MTDPVYLPDLPRARVLQPSYVDAGGVLRGSHGGAAQPISRLGDHWMFEVQLPTMKWETEARLWTSKLLTGQVRRKVAFPLFFPGFQIGVPGSSVLVDGAVVGGTSLPLRGLTPHYDFQALQFLSIIHAGRRYVYAVDEAAVADVNGDVTLTINPMLRTSLTDGDVVEVGQPIVEGSLVNDGRFTWSIDEAKMTGLQFIVEELE